MIKELLLVMLACIAADNYVLGSFLGYDSVAKESGKSLKSNLFTALMLTLTLVIAVTVTNALEMTVIPMASSLRTLIYVAVIMISAALVSLLVSKVEALKGCVTFTSILLNAAVLGTLLLVNISEYGWLTSYFAVIGTGIGYYLVSVIMNGVVDRINMKSIPESFRGYPIMLAAFAIVAMAIFAF